MSLDSESSESDSEVESHDIEIGRNLDKKQSTSMTTADINDYRFQQQPEQQRFQQQHEQQRF